MRTDMSPQPKALRDSFAQPRLHTSIIHELEPGSILFGYPGSPYGQGVFFLTHIDQMRDGFAGLHLNGEQCSRLSLVVKHCLEADIPAEMDAPVLTGGAADSNRITIVTTHDWYPDSDNSFVVGAYRLHFGLDALRAIADGYRPPCMRLFCGMIQGPYKELEKSLHGNDLGEIAASDDMLFSNRAPEAIWRSAMIEHTGGKPLYIPAPYQSPSLVPGEERPPVLYRN